MLKNVEQFRGDKIFQHLDRLALWQSGGNPIPITVELDPTNLCNLKCPYCNFRILRRENKQSLDKNTMKMVIKELGKLGVRGITFTGGGDPLCNPDTLYAVKLAKKSGMNVGFITNGVLQTPEISEIILQNCIWYRLSLDADCQETYERMHKVNAFHKVISNLETIIQIKKKIKSKCTIGVGYLTGMDSITGILPVAKLCKSMGVDYIQFRPIVLNDIKKFRKYSLEVWPETIKNLKVAFKEASGNFKVLFSLEKYQDFNKPNFGRNYKNCFAHHFATVIGSSGDVWLCCHLRGNTKYSLGNIKKQSFKEIWFSAKRKKIYNSIDLKNDCQPLCRLHPQNKILWQIKQPVVHKNFI